MNIVQKKLLKMDPEYLDTIYIVFALIIYFGFGPYDYISHFYQSNRNPFTFLAVILILLVSFFIIMLGGIIPAYFINKIHKYQEKYTENTELNEI